MEPLRTQVRAAYKLRVSVPLLTSRYCYSNSIFISVASSSLAPRRPILFINHSRQIICLECAISGFETLFYQLDSHGLTRIVQLNKRNLFWEINIVRFRTRSLFANTGVRTTRSKIANSQIDNISHSIFHLNYHRNITLSFSSRADFDKIVTMDYKSQLTVDNELWRRYRVAGEVANPSAQDLDEIRGRIAQGDPSIASLPNQNPLRYFHNHRFTRQPYLLTAGNLTIPSGIVDPIERPLDARVQTRYHEVVEYFGNPRYEVRGPLGMGSSGFALHFRDRGLYGTNIEGTDIAVKAALRGWTSNLLRKEKQMMRVRSTEHPNQNHYSHAMEL